MMTLNAHLVRALVLVLTGVFGGGFTGLMGAEAQLAARQAGAPSPGPASSAPIPPPDTPAAAAPTPGTEAPANVSNEQVNRVRRALEHKPLVDLKGEQLQFYVQIIGRPPMTFADYARGSDLMHGPTRRGNPMSHQEFLSMVTPREMYSSGGITPSELLQFALTNWLGQTLVRRGLEEINEARTEQEKQEIRDRIDRELLILKANEDKLP